MHHENEVLSLGPAQFNQALRPIGFGRLLSDLFEEDKRLTQKVGKESFWMTWNGFELVRCATADRAKRVTEMRVGFVEGSDEHIVTPALLFCRPSACQCLR